MLLCNHYEIHSIDGVKFKFSRIFRWFPIYWARRIA